MDKVRAQAIAASLIGRRIGGWEIAEFINNGKSAAVLRAVRDGKAAAIKVFDREIIERFGASVQLERIRRELRLIGHGHPNIVEIYDGGYDEGTDSYFVAMEYIAAENLEDLLQAIPADDIPAIVHQLASAAQKLEELELVHRDIKPSNIVYRPESKLVTLLDLGVLGPIGYAGKLTDHNGKAFIGTLQYSSPEYLLREEDGTADGWRALTFYQIGAVMHDLIMKRPIFQEFAEPFSRLVNAVQYEQPVIQSSNVMPQIVELARRCLLKKPEVRLSLINWDDFERLGRESKSSAKERVTNRVITGKASQSEAVATINEDRQRVETEAAVSRLLRDALRKIRNDNAVFPPVVVVPNKGSGGVKAIFQSSERHGLPDGLQISIRCNVIDPAEQVVILAGSQEVGEDSSEHQVTFFKGVMDGGAIYAALEEFVYATLDAAQAK
jgi:eukaryotic-like serine/threonine-protein kinase